MPHLFAKEQQYKGQCFPKEEIEISSAFSSNVPNEKNFWPKLAKWDKIPRLDQIGTF